MNNKDIQYYPIELHTHTNHSDGIFSVEELIKHAIEFGYTGIFVTDHNTMSAHEEISDKKLNEFYPIFKGVEWTTFHGHMLILGCNDVGDWATANIHNMDECIAKIKSKENAVIGTAHPFSIGNPICPGCHWEYVINDWNNIDFIEICNSSNPQDVYWNEEAYEFWVNKLNEGYKIAATSGRDWHYKEWKNINVAITYVGVVGILSTASVVSAIKNGRVFTTLGPIMEFEIVQDGNRIQLGDSISSSSELKITINIKRPELKSFNNMNIVPKYLRVFKNDSYIDYPMSYDTTFEISYRLEYGYVRFEVIGDFNDRSDIRLVTTSPIYVK